MMRGILSFLEVFQKQDAIEKKWRNVENQDNGEETRDVKQIAEASLDEPVAAWRSLRVGHVIDVIAQGDKQVEEELAATVVHLKLHRSASFECGAAANDEGEVVSTQFGVGVGRVRVGVASRGEDGAALNTGFCCDGGQ